MGHSEKWPRKQIGITDAAGYERRRALFDVLEEVFPARFRPVQASSEGLDAVIILEGDLKLSQQLTESPCPVFVVDPQSASRRFRPRVIRFVGRPWGQPLLFGHSIRLKQAGEVGVVTVKDDDDVIALADEYPVWVQRRNAFGHCVIGSGPLPDYHGTGPLIMDLIRGAFVPLLPLLSFVREVTAPFDFDPAPIRACFMFDDPNLHWTTWGHLDYRQLIREASLHDYHVAMATVPIDAWYTSPTAASLFRDHPDRVSLLMHGVSHTHAELVQPQAEDLRRHNLVRGLRWIERLEQRHALRVSRVMAPPHHACSPETAKLLLQLGYEAACVAPTWLVRWNPEVRWPAAFGLRPVEFLEGFPVISRFNFADRDDVRIYMAALFRQPIVLLGHHGEVADGLGILSETAAKIRTLGPVQWCDMTTIARGAYLTKLIGNSLWINMQTRRVSVPIPEGVQDIYLVRSWLAGEALEPILLQLAGMPECREIGGQTIGPIPASPGLAEFRSLPSGAMAAAPNSRRFLPPVWPWVRRALCEGRDRLSPLVKWRGGH